MHHDTFEELTKAVEAARRKLDEEHLAYLRTLGRRSGAVQDEEPHLSAPD
jgi:hypothetical protein